ncbi:hypothetical protein ANCCAN_26689 [Ancylostoma caninum]|uniref:Uncharacterized protein n=1 Tax=Ancylostoma caninum TaxID=29170 RepID=A0A368F637_ANCCA|nr:hypothetical protein ANCCAN_26689 [Ancylostoma caninum]
MDGKRAYKVRRNSDSLHVNITFTVVSHSSNGVILFAKGDKSRFALRCEMRRVVAE